LPRLARRQPPPLLLAPPERLPHPFLHLGHGELREGSGNIFQDLGAREAEERLAQAELARVIRGEIRERGLTQVRAAELLGITQPDVSDLVDKERAEISVELVSSF
jgi:predicted XRE-type DNA-binding protein